MKLLSENNLIGNSGRQPTIKVYYIPHFFPLKIKICIRQSLPDDIYFYFLTHSLRQSKSTFHHKKFNLHQQETRTAVVQPQTILCKELQKFVEKEFKRSVWDAGAVKLVYSSTEHLLCSWLTFH